MHCKVSNLKDFLIQTTELEKATLFRINHLIEVTVVKQTDDNGETR